MAMKKCKECGQEVSTGAKACPHCGVQDPTGKAKKIFKYGCLPMLGIFAVLVIALVGAVSHEDKQAGEKAGAPLPSDARDVTQSPEYKAWRAFGDDYAALIREGNRLFGVAPHDGLQPGQKLKLEKASFLVPWPGAGSQRPETQGVSYIKQAVPLQPGETVVIEDRLLKGNGMAKWYLVKVPGRKGVYGYFNSVVLMWYDTQERLLAHDKKVRAWRDPRYQDLVKKHFTSKGLDRAKVEAMAAKGKWGL